MLHVDANTREILERIKERARSMKDTGEGPMGRALQRIGNYAVASAKVRAGQQRIRDQGHLINAIRWESVDDGILVGVFGVPYAAMNEFGGPFSDRQRRAMFRAIHLRGGPPREPKGVIIGKYWRARPYLYPAITQNKTVFMDIIREELARG